MPKRLDPSSNLKLILPSDQNKQNPPAFIMKCMSKREFSALTEALQGVDEESADISSLDGLDDILNENCQSWENMGKFVHSTHRLEDVLTFQEMIELAVLIIEANTASGDELGKSDTLPAGSVDTSVIVTQAQ